MVDLVRIVNNYSNKYEKKIKNICFPLLNCLNIQIFTYGFIEADGRFGYISNNIEMNEYYFSQKVFLHNPYFANPSFFRSGVILCPCSPVDDIQQTLMKRFRADHLLLSLHVSEGRLEFFIFANEGIDEAQGNRYMPYLNELHKFGQYFKREAAPLIGKMRSEQFNIQQERGQERFQKQELVPLSLDPATKLFLKKTFALSPQEQRCLAHFKNGKSAQATAALMNLSRRTVEHYFENIKDKLGCSSKYDLLNY